MDALLDGLDPRQLAAVTSDAMPLAILAPAGSGKTRVLTRRIAWRVREASATAAHVLAVTFTRRAAGELVDRLGALGIDGVTAGTFHALALAQLRRRAVEARRSPPTVLASKPRLLAELLDARTPRGTAQRRAPSRVAIGDFAGEIDWAKARMVGPDAYPEAARAAGRRPPASFADVADLYARYEAAKRSRRTYDFDDLLAVCAQTIEQDATFAATQRWKFRHVFVDEFQDATPLQLRLLRAWLGPNVDLCVVGDPAQAIYGFAGADATPLVEFTRYFPSGTVIALDRNYRSTPQIVGVAESVLRGDGSVEREVVAVRPTGPAPRVRTYTDDDAEARAVADACWRAFTRGVPWHAMAVLVRTNAQTVAFTNALARRGVPSRTATTGRFSERPEVRSMLDELRAAERESPGRAFEELLADLAAAPTDTVPDPDDFDVDTIAAIEAADADAAATRAALARAGREYLATEAGAGSTAGFVAWLELAQRKDAGPASAVDVLTFHRAKGLEWSVVFVTGLEAGLVPIAWATTADAVAEERRLLHVALGRAEEELHLSWAQARGSGRQRAARESSPWLPTMVARARADAPPPVDPAAALAGARAALEAATPPQPVPRARRRR